MSNVVTWYGVEKSGKTTLGFSAIRAFPDGIQIHFDFDLGRERAIWRFPDDIANRIKSVRFPEIPNWTMGSGAITKQWAEFERIYEQALNDPQVKVVFIDTGSQMHRLNADEYLENYVKRNKPTRHQLQQIEYKTPNSRTRAKIMAARAAEKLLLISHYEQDIYQEQFVQRPDGSMTKESVKTGQKTHTGFGETPYLTDHHLRLYLKNVNVDAAGRELLPPILKTVAEIKTPNPPMAFGLELMEPSYIRLMELIDGIKRMELMQNAQAGQI